MTDAAATSDSMCNSGLDPSGCHGVLEWLDGSAFEWGQTEFNDWSVVNEMSFNDETANVPFYRAPPVVRKDSGENCVMIDGDPGSKIVDDIFCTGASLKPICHIVCP